jgi:hypothetical protein
MDAQYLRGQRGLPYFPNQKRRLYKDGNYHSTSLGASERTILQVDAASEFGTNQAQGG